jgi:hypothetical protein
MRTLESRGGVLMSVLKVEESNKVAVNTRMFLECCAEVRLYQPIQRLDQGVCRYVSAHQRTWS